MRNTPARTPDIDLRQKMEIRRLNTLRGIAAMIVLVGHYSNRAQLWDAVLGTRAPQLGVMLFFLLSAFLMSVLYMSKPPTGVMLRKYAFARAGRVLPLYFLVVIASYGLASLGIPWLTASVYDIPDVKSLISHLLFLYGIQVLWTIPTEIHFYGIFALLWWLRPKIPWVVPVFSLIVLGIFTSGHWPIGPKQPIHGFPIDLPLLRGLPYFVVGMALGMLYLKWRPRPNQQHSAYLLAFVLLLLLYPAILQRLTGLTYVMWFNPLILLAMGLIFFCLVFMVPDGNPVLENKPGDFLGKISYSMYLLHFPVLLAMRQADLLGGVSGLLLFLAITIVASALTHRYFEVPMRTWIRSMGSRPPRESTR